MMIISLFYFLANAFFYLCQSADYTLFLTRSDIFVTEEKHKDSTRPKVFSGGHDEKYWAHDKDNIPYKLRLKDALPCFAEIGTSAILDLVGLPNLTVYPILLKRGIRGIPVGTGRAGNKGSWFQATIQKAINLQEYKMDKLNGVQLAELLGHLIINYIVGNNDIGLGHKENIGFDGEHFYTLDATQSFKEYPNSNDGFYPISLFPMYLLEKLSPQEKKNFETVLFPILDRVENLNISIIRSILDPYFDGINSFRKFKNLKVFDFRKKLINRLKNIRVTLKNLRLPNVGVSSNVQPIAISFLPSQLKDKHIPSAKANSSAELLWSFYFQDYFKIRDMAYQLWKKELAQVEEIQDPILSIQEKSLIVKKNQHFPNFFLHSKYTQDNIIKMLEKVLLSVIYRLDIPYVKNKKVTHKDFTLEILAAAKKIDPNCKIYFSGGVVRSLLGYVYHKLFKEYQKHPEKDVIDLLSNIIKEKSLTIPRALGIGSDLDVVVEASNPNLNHSLIEEITKIINSARDFYQLKGNKDPFITSILPFGDVHSYEEQLSRSVKNGGSTLDFLALDIQSGFLRMPKEYPQIVYEFLQGEVNYVEGIQREASDITTIRGIRSFLEIPFLQSTEQGRMLLNQEIRYLIDRLKQGENLIEPVLRQFVKAAKNARFGGAYNRFFESEDPLDQDIRELIMVIGKHGKKGLFVIPRYILRSQVKQPKFLLQNLFMDQEEFRQKFTDKGILYHGTEEMENFLNMIRNGPIISDETQGRASCGSGAYTTSSFDTAAGYGCVINFGIKWELSPRILNLDQFKDEGTIAGIIKKAKEENVDPHQVLAKDYGVDIIISSGYPLIQNSQIIKLPKNISDLINLKVQELLFPLTENIQDYSKILGKVKDFLKLSYLVSTLGLKYVKNIEEIILSLFKNLNKNNSNLATDVLEMAIFHHNSNIRRIGMEFLEAQSFEFLTKVIPKILEKEPDQELQRLAIEKLAKYKTQDPGPIIVQYMKSFKKLHSSLNFYTGPSREIILEYYLDAKNNSEAMREFVVELLLNDEKDFPLFFSTVTKDPSMSVRKKAIEQLWKIDRNHLSLELTQQRDFIIKTLMTDENPMIRRVTAEVASRMLQLAPYDVYLDNLFKENPPLESLIFLKLGSRSIKSEINKIKGQKLLQDSRFLFRLLGLYLLEFVEDFTPPAHFYLEGLDPKNELDIRLFTIETIPKLKIQQLWPVIIFAIKDNDMEVISKVANLLTNSTIKFEEAIVLIFDELKNDPKRDDKIKSMMNVYVNNDFNRNDELLKLILSTNSHLQFLAIQLLEEFPSNFLDPVRKILQRKDLDYLYPLLFNVLMIRFKKDLDNFPIANVLKMLAKTPDQIKQLEELVEESCNLNKNFSFYHYEFQDLLKKLNSAPN